MKTTFFIPQNYRGRLLRKAKNIVKSILLAGKETDTCFEIVVSCLKDSYYIESEFQDLIELGVSIRETVWEKYDCKSAKLIMELNGYINYKIKNDNYLLPHDGMNDFIDSDIWIIFTDKLDHPVLPIKEYICINCEYTQRYVPQIVGANNDYFWKKQAKSFFEIVRNASRIIITNPAIKDDVINYVGLSDQKISTLSLCFNVPSINNNNNIPLLNYDNKEYFVWVIDFRLFERNYITLDAIKKYLIDGGRLKVIVVEGEVDSCEYVFRKNTDKLNKDSYVERKKKLISLIQEEVDFKSRIIIKADLNENEYYKIFAGARFILNGSVDEENTMCVIDAAYLGVPSISSKYPIIDFLDKELNLNIQYVDLDKSASLYNSLFQMEMQSFDVKLPSKDKFDRLDWSKKSTELYKLITEE